MDFLIVEPDKVVHRGRTSITQNADKGDWGGCRKSAREMELAMLRMGGGRAGFAAYLVLVQFAASGNAQQTRPNSLPIPRAPSLMPANAMPARATSTGTTARAPDGNASAPNDPVAAVSSVPVPGTFGLGDFERIAMQRNPTLKQAAAQFEATLSRSYQAGLYPNPTVGYVEDQIGSFSESRPTASGFAVGGRPSPGDNVGAFIQWQIVTAGKLRLSRAKFAEEANAARWQAIAQQLRVLNGVRVQFFQVLASQRMIEIQRELSRLNDEAVQTTQELANVGQANEPDLLQARIEGRRAKVALQNAENHYRGSWEELISLIGAPELRPILLDARPLEVECPPLDFEYTLTDLLQRSPEIQATLSEIRRDQIMVQRERVEPIPNIVFQAVTGYNYEFGVQTAGVQVGIALPIFNRNQGTIREAMSDLARDHGEHERIALSLRKRLAEAYTRYLNAKQSVDDYRAETLPLAQRAYQVQLANFRQRRAAWPQVLVAQRTYLDLNKDYVESLFELRRAEVEIGGMLLVDGLSAPASPTSQGHIEAVATPR
jgi:cobalt-zinc-cadmium efflux system outer membrane protein